MKKFRIFAIAFVCCVLLFLIFFYIPKPIKTSMWVCDATDQTFEMELDIKWHRRLFTEPHLTGSVFLNGEEYIDDAALYKTFPGQIRYRDEARTFCKKSGSEKTGVDILKATLNSIRFWTFDDGDPFEEFCFMYMDESMEDNGHISGIVYYGPAKTVEEAQKLAARFGQLK